MSAPHEANGTVAGQVLTGTKVRDVVGMLADSDLPVAVVDSGGTRIGIVTRATRWCDRRRGRVIAMTSIAVDSVASSAVEPAFVPEPHPNHLLRTGVIVALLTTVVLVGSLLWGDVPSWLDSHIQREVRQMYGWITANRQDHWLFTKVFGPIADVIDACVRFVLWTLRGLRWTGVLVLTGRDRSVDRRLPRRVLGHVGDVRGRRHGLLGSDDDHAGVDDRLDRAGIGDRHPDRHLDGTQRSGAAPAAADPRTPPR